MLVVLNGVKGRQTIDKQIHKELSMAENEGAAVAVDNAAVPTNEWERMLSGELYICGDMQREANMRKRRLVHAINTSAYDAFEERDRLFRELFGSLGKGAFLEPPFNCDYGCNTYIGDNFYANMDCIFLDVARITIGDRVFFGPRVACTRHTIQSMRPYALPVRKAPVRSPSAMTCGSAAAWWSVRALPSAMMW